MSKDLFGLIFTYATSSEKWGDDWQRGKFPVKIYTIDGILIYQLENGGDNTNKIPLGGVIVQGSAALSMAISITNPITYYGGGTWAVINQDGHSRDLYDYYWTSYSRGTDGRHSPNEPQWHNDYLDGYIPLRGKSIYDPCPYLYRIPSNGSWNQFDLNAGWTQFSYLAGLVWNLNTLEESWFLGLGWRNGGSSYFEHTGVNGFYRSSTASGQTVGYILQFDSGKGIHPNRHDIARSYGYSVRCIDFATAGVTFVAPKVTKMPKAKRTSASL